MTLDAQNDTILIIYITKCTEQDVENKRGKYYTAQKYKTVLYILFKHLNKTFNTLDTIHVTILQFCYSFMQDCNLKRKII